MSLTLLDRMSKFNLKQNQIFLLFTIDKQTHCRRPKLGDARARKKK